MFPSHDPAYDPVLPNVGDDRMLKHFQYRALSILSHSPKFAILAVDAGGGKTITIIANILQELEKGTVKRPLIVCPAHLVKDYVGEINYFNEAKMNAVVINKHTIENYGKDAILQLVHNAPKNTIFISAYDSFSLGASLQMYANTEVDDYRFLDVFRKAEFDGVWLDESHYIKNESARSDAIFYALLDRDWETSKKR